MRYKIPKKCEILFLLKGGFSMKKYVCTICRYEYAPKDNKNSDFKELAEDWICPICGAKKISSPKRKTNSKKFR